jgi:hypothetical protein
MPGGLFRAKGNSVYAGGPPRDWATATFKVGVATNLRAGVFVKKGASDDLIIVCPAGDPDAIGVMTEKNLTNPKWDPATAPAVGDEMEVALIGTGAQVWVRNTANITAGKQLFTGANGRAAAAAFAAAADAGKIVGRALVDNDGSGAESDLLAVI